MFQSKHHHQGAHYMSFLMLDLLKQSIKMHCCGLSQVTNSAADIYHQGPDNICSHTTRLTTHRCILIDCFNIVTLVWPNSALPDDGDYTETCWSCFNVNFSTPFKLRVHQLV